ncbi:unnamed protein product [Darwinula stevensoni]|uniref:Nucleoporin NUP42 n=1 Tax=Darwinula stevensoni TaxID=69355 RepID=A0A7R9A4T1_9CRUS|nr:unnamed protein product [Darwinula stevensoni]CAG0894179.1 unnamed protein product [Darwinula stevensoni]
MSRRSTVCSFFMRGACKFGENCRYEHPGYYDYPVGGPSHQYRRPYGYDEPPEYNYGWSGQDACHGGGLESDWSWQQGSQGYSYDQSQNRQFSGGQYGDESQGSRKQRKQPSKEAAMTMEDPKNKNEILEALKKEMMTWGNSNMWRLSCFAPVRAAPNVPGFIEISPEEIQYMKLQSEAQGKSEEYGHDIKGMVHGNDSVRQQICSPTSQQAEALVVLVLRNNSIPESLFHNHSANLVQKWFQSCGDKVVAPVTLSFKLPSATGGAFQQMESEEQTNTNTAPPTNKTFGVQLQFKLPASGTIPLTTGQDSVKIQETLTPVSKASSVYSRHEDLTEKELSEFMAPRFTLGSIPTRPPPQELI